MFLIDKVAILGQSHNQEELPVLKKAILAAAVLAAVASPAAAVTREQALATCKKNPFLRDSNMLLLACVEQEIEAAGRVADMLRTGGAAAARAKRTCEGNPFLNGMALLSACMEQEMEAGVRLYGR